MTSLLSYFYDFLLTPLEKAGIQSFRKRLIKKGVGTILEVGCGTGLNFPYYQPGQVSQVYAIEPDPVMRKKAENRSKNLPVSIKVMDGRGEELPFPDQSFDTVIFFLVLCTIPDPQKALQEIHRVLKPGGKVLFFEHVMMPQRSLSTLQDWFTPVWKKVCDGCHLNRDTLTIAKNNGYTIKSLEIHMKGLVIFGSMIPSSHLENMVR